MTAWYLCPLSRWLVAGFGLVVSAGSATADWKAPRQALVLRYVTGDIRIFDAPLPGQLSDTALAQLAAQFERADVLYSQRVGLQAPLQSSKYRAAKSIDVHLLPLKRQMGSAGDAVVSYRYRLAAAPSSALTISLSRRWQPGNLTPEHELFHSYQYAYTYFKNAWFLEGMARSIQDWFSLTQTSQQMPSGQPALPNNAEQLNALLKKSYNAAPFWSRLRWLCDPTCALPRAATTTHEPVCGGRLVKAVLEEFQSADALAAKARDLESSNWTEQEQRSERNNAWMLGALAKAMMQQCPVMIQPELAEFAQVLRQMQLP
ncbi:MAG: hypothetical protein COW02_16665 [Comamonadaceae bacterium CG12_big_fil_rev_8_21_14_0_65_59_15]|nr:MAG: hypothetical protein COW02_16665 [Comamonadaceae bacterium CG12_big_fil_rev_8_21_14_0_65_59_15]